MRGVGRWDARVLGLLLGAGVVACTSSELNHRLWERESGGGESAFARDRDACLRDSKTAMTRDARRMGYARPSDTLQVDEEIFRACLEERGWQRRW